LISECCPNQVKEAERKYEQAQQQFEKISQEKNFFEREQHSLRSFVMTTATSMLAHVKATKKVKRSPNAPYVLTNLWLECTNACRFSIDLLAILLPCVSRFTDSV
jgi:DNA topoisomerase IA